MYMLDYDGKEHNLQFAIENWWIGDIASFHSEEPSRFYIEAIENSVILQIKKEDQLRLFVDHPKFNRIFRVFTENELVNPSCDVGKFRDSKKQDYARQLMLEASTNKITFNSKPFAVIA